MSGAPIFDAEGIYRGAYTTVVDFTERKKMEEELSKKKADVEAINKELEDCTYTVSHALQYPLRSIKPFSGTRRRSAYERANHYLNRLKNDSARMGNLIDDLLTLSRAEGKTEFEKVDLKRK